MAMTVFRFTPFVFPLIILFTVSRDMQAFIRLLTGLGFGYSIFSIIVHSIIKFLYIVI